MKQSEKSIITTSIVIVVFTIAIGLLFVHHGFERNFIHELPVSDNGEVVYDSLLNLYQTRVNVVNWGIACIGALLTFMAFYVQYQYNNSQKEDLAKERFENKLFHLLDNYREICSQTSIPGVGNGKIAFHYMFYEYKAIYKIVTSNEAIMREISNPNDPHCLDYIVFVYFINGITATSLKAAIREGVITERGDELIQAELMSRQRSSENYNPEKDKPEVDGVTYIMDYRHKHIKYFDGHRFRLIPYIKYVSLILDFILAENEVQDIKYLISEQTDHEIALLYAYNGYRKYGHQLMGNTAEFMSKEMASLYEKMYTTLPGHMIHKFKYNSGHFFS
jgi:hypothetical protein